MTKKEPGQYDWAHSKPLPSAHEAAKFISTLNAWQQEKIHIATRPSYEINLTCWIVFYRKGNQ